MKRFIKFTIFLPIFLFSFSLEFNKKFSKSLPHDILRTHLIITITDKTEKKVDTRLNKFNELIKSYGKVEKKLGTFNIRPKFRHSSNTPTIIGYLGELRYKVESDKALYMDEFITQITDLKEFRDTTVSITNLSWTVKEATYNVTLDLLRLEAINWAKRYAYNLSKDIKEHCIIKDIKIGITPTLFKRTLLNSFDSKDRQLTVPQANQEMIEINPNFIMECK